MENFDKIRAEAIALAAKFPIKHLDTSWGGSEAAIPSGQGEAFGTLNTAAGVNHFDEAFLESLEHREYMKGETVRRYL